MRVGAELRLLQGVVVVPVVVVVLVGDLHYTACVPAPLLLLLGDGFAVGPVLVRSLAPMSLHVDAARLLVAHLLRQAFAVRDRGEPPGVFRGFGEKTRLLLLLEQPAPDPGLGDGVGVLRGGRVVPVVHGIRGGGRVVPVVVVVDVHDTARELAPLLPPLRLVLRDGFAVGPVLVRPRHSPRACTTSSTPSACSSGWLRSRPRSRTSAGTPWRPGRSPPFACSPSSAAPRRA